MVVKATASGLSVALPRDRFTDRDTVKLRGHPKAAECQAGSWKRDGGRGERPWVRQQPLQILQWTIRSQVLKECVVGFSNREPSSSPMDAVHRLNGSGLMGEAMSLRYSRPPVERPACWRMELGPESQQEGWITSTWCIYTKGALLLDGREPPPLDKREPAA